MENSKGMRYDSFVDLQAIKDTERLDLEGTYCDLKHSQLL